MNKLKKTTKIVLVVLFKKIIKKTMNKLYKPTKRFLFQITNQTKRRRSIILISKVMNKYLNLNNLRKYLQTSSNKLSNLPKIT